MDIDTQLKNTARYTTVAMIVDCKRPDLKISVHVVFGTSSESLNLPTQGGYIATTALEFFLFEAT